MEQLIKMAIGEELTANEVNEMQKVLSLTISEIPLPYVKDIDNDLIVNILQVSCELFLDSCSDACPVFKLNNSNCPNKDNNPYCCDTLLNGAAMLHFIRTQKFKNKINNF
jgi:hypothetical protein